MNDLAQVSAAWDRIAPGYDRLVTSNYFDLSANALRGADLRAGSKLLDVAAGSGALSIAAARMGAEVLAVDISPKMIEHLEARAHTEGLALQGRVMDGHALDLSDNTFDIAASQFGVMLFPDLARGLREMVRVTKPDGRVVVIAFGSIAKAEFFGFFVRAIQSVLPDFKGPPERPLPFQLSDPDVFRKALVDAGLHDIRIEPTVKEMPFRSGEHLWDWLMNSNPIPSLVLAQLKLTPDQITKVRETLAELVRERAGGKGTAVLTAAINIGYGTK